MNAPPLYTRAFTLLVGLQFVFGLGFSTFALLPKYLAEVHSAGAREIGFVTAASPLAAVITIPVLAAYVDRVSRRRLMILGALLMCAGSLGFVLFSEQVALFYLWRALHGAAFTVFMGAGSALVADVAAPKRLAQSIGLLGAANLATNAIGPAVAELAAERVGWLWVFLGAASTSAVALVCTKLVHERPPAREPTDLSRASAVWDPRFVRILYCGLMLGIGFGTLTTFYQPLALEIGIRTVGDLFVGNAITALAVRVLFGSWLDRFERRTLAVASASLYAVVLFGAAAMQPGWLFVLGLGLGLAHGIFWPVLTALGIEKADFSVRGARMAYLGGSFHLGVMQSTLGFGWLAEHTGYRAVIAGSGVFVASAVVLLLALDRVRKLPPSTPAFSDGERRRVAP